MTLDEAVKRWNLNEFLNHLRASWLAYEVLAEHRRRLFDAATLQAQRISGMPSGGGVSDPVGTAVVAMNELTEKITKKLRQYEDVQLAAEDLFSKMDERHANVLRCYYSMAMTWDDVAAACDYSPDYIRHLGRTAYEQALSIWWGIVETF